MPRRLSLVLAALTACLALIPTAAQARTAVRVGIGDQTVAMFDQPAFQRAKFKRVRYFIAWNAMDNTAARLAARAFVLRARRDGFSVLICSQLLMFFSSPRRKNPRSLMSKPGDLKLRLDAKRVRSPPILLMLIFPDDPASDVAPGSSWKAVAPGRWK